MKRELMPKNPERDQSTQEKNLLILEKNLEEMEKYPTLHNAAFARFCRKFLVNLSPYNVETTSVLLDIWKTHYLKNTPPFSQESNRVEQLFLEYKDFFKEKNLSIQELFIAIDDLCTIDSFLKLSGLSLDSTSQDIRTKFAGKISIFEDLPNDHQQRLKKSLLMRARVQYFFDKDIFKNLEDICLELEYSLSEEDAKGLLADLFSCKEEDVVCTKEDLYRVLTEKKYPRVFYALYSQKNFPEVINFEDVDISAIEERYNANCKRMYFVGNIDLRKQETAERVCTFGIFQGNVRLSDVQPSSMRLHYANITYCDSELGEETTEPSSCEVAGYGSISVHRPLKDLALGAGIYHLELSSPVSRLLQVPYLQSLDLSFSKIPQSIEINPHLKTLILQNTESRIWTEILPIDNLTSLTMRGVNRSNFPTQETIASKARGLMHLDLERGLSIVEAYPKNLQNLTMREISGPIFGKKLEIPTVPNVTLYVKPTNAPPELPEDISNLTILFPQSTPPQNTIPRGVKRLSSHYQVSGDGHAQSFPNFTQENHAPRVLTNDEARKAYKDFFKNG